MTSQGHIFGCRRQNKKYTSIAVNNDLFEQDPCLLSHNCIPMDRNKDKANRVAYESCQKIKRAPQKQRITPGNHFNETAFSILKSSWKSMEARRKVLANFVKTGYASRRCSFTRATSSQVDRVEMNSVPEELRNLPDGEDFLQIQLRIHIYYSDVIIATVIEIGLKALIGDGVHKLNPITIQAGIEKGQLYTVHAMCDGGFEVPILFAVTQKKNRATYKLIFDCLKEKLGNGNFRIILDYEKAAIRVVREAFPNAQLQGCAFHLAQAWNRMAKHSGLRQFIKGSKKVRAVARWWHTIKGIVFLPRELNSRVPALLYPPVNSRHPSYEPCKKFLEYLRETWFEGVYKDMWHKYNIEELRTTNVAEAFHKKLRGLLGRRTHPPFEQLLECLQRITVVALGILLHVMEHPRTLKPLRKKDILRRNKIIDAMRCFREEYETGNYIPTSSINNFCIKMSKFGTEKAI